MKRALPLLIALALPLAAFADDLTNPVTPLELGDPVPVTKTGEPEGYKVIPLGQVKVISVEEMMKSGGLITSENFPATTNKRKKKKKKRPIVPIAVAAGLFGIASASQGNGSTTLATPVVSDRAPNLPGSTITRAAISPEPGSAALCLLLLPVVAGYFRTRSRNA